MPEVDFTFIIPTKNEEQYIGDCLESIRKQKGRYEIIVVDSHSQDNTVRIARKYAKVLFEKRRGPGVARNTGAKKARGNILVFIDSDVVVPGDFLKRLKGNFKEPIVGCIFKQKTDTSLVWFWNLLVKYATRAGFIITNGCCFAFDAATFRKAGGFDSNLLTNEDHDMARRISLYGRFFFMDDIGIFVSSRRMRRGMLKFLKLNLKATLTYFLNRKSLPEYWG